jgi:hypothetical protein
LNLSVYSLKFSLTIVEMQKSIDEWFLKHRLLVQSTIPKNYLWLLINLLFRKIA